MFSDPYNLSKMKILIAILGLCLSGFVLRAQESPHCSPSTFKQAAKDYVAGGSIFEKQLLTYKTRAANSRQQAHEVLYLPVVVHIIHSGEALGNGKNISYRQIQGQIDELNKDFAGKNINLSSTEPQFLHLAENANIQFVLAKTDPKGALLTELGVHRFHASEQSWTPTSFNNIIKPLTQWDPKRYINIWVTDIAEDTEIGYATLPFIEMGSVLPYQPHEEGIVIDYQRFGSKMYFESSHLLKPESLGRVLTHEMGHFLGLLHLWGENIGDCNSDFCEDTPPVSSYHTACDVRQEGCTASAPMIQNFMDYAPEICRTFFSSDQVWRMRACLEFVPQRAALLNSGSQQAAYIADFTASATTICAGEGVFFQNQSYSKLGTLISQAEWFFEGASVQTSKESELWVHYPRAGTYGVKLVSKTGYEEDSIYLPNFITVYDPSTFTNVAQLPPSSESELLMWHNTGNRLFTHTTDGVFCSSFSDLNRNSAILESPNISLLEPNGFKINSLKISFEWAGATGITAQDSFVIEISEDCGQSYKPIWLLSGMNMASSPQYRSIKQPLLNPMNSDFLSVELLFEPNSKEVSHIKARLVFVGQNGNVLHIRNLSIQDSEGKTPVASIEAEQVYALVGERVRYFDVSSGSPVRLSYTFEAANERFSNERSPSTSFPAAGIFKVVLEASNEWGKSTTSINQRVLDAKKHYDTGFKTNGFQGNWDLQAINGAAMRYDPKQFKLDSVFLVGADVFLENADTAAEFMLEFYQGTDADLGNLFEQKFVKKELIQRQFKKGSFIRVVLDNPTYISHENSFSLGVRKFGNLEVKSYNKAQMTTWPYFIGNNSSYWQPYRATSNKFWAVFPILSFRQPPSDSPQDQVTVYPNPNKGDFIYFKSQGKAIVKVEIYHINGQLIKKNINFSSNDSVSNRYFAYTQLSELNNGFYIAQIYTEDGIYSEKIAIIR
ncbi:MAG: T9SS C-terminal target domain-containing protein [Cytophagales bacterium]|nr:MAG: T9SS C-terminal target domain-containing protein [Cytophagales bacterium]TAF60410.1 MAG: T9SS C-terminal target domain-containing protein [Cytophagales bacterium]